MDSGLLNAVNESLDRCVANPVFLDRFYEIFLSSSPKVDEKFRGTNFLRQKRALQASLHGLLSLAESGGNSADDYLREAAERHNRARLDIGGELYDLWLDSLLSTVKECDPQATPEVLQAWEAVMQLGIRYFLSHY